MTGEDDIKALIKDVLKVEQNISSISTMEIGWVVFFVIQKYTIPMVNRL
jgi:hypothetical protein